MTDQDTSAQLPPPKQPPNGPKRLLRSRGDRVIAGVAGGLGRYFGVDPVIVRIAFAVSVFFGGLGALAYVGLALFVPTAPGEDGEIGPPPIERSRGLAIAAGIGLVVVALSWGIFDGPWSGGFFLSPLLLIAALIAGAVVIARRTGGLAGVGRGGARSTFVSVLIGLAAFAGLAVLALAAAWAAATGHGVAIAIAVIAIGAMLVAAAFSGGARWLIAPAIALAVPLGAVTAAEISFADGIGEREYRPLTVASIPDDGYELGVGQMVVDLRDLDWRDARVVDLNVDLGLGQLLVAVPSDVCVVADLDARAGDLHVAGDESNGFDVHNDANAGATAKPRLELSGEIDIGELRVINDDDVDLDRRFYGQLPGPDQMTADLRAACAPPEAATSPDGGGRHGQEGAGR